MLSALVVGGIGAAYDLLLGQVKVEFVQPIAGGAFEFQVRNDTPADFKLVMLRRQMYNPFFLSGKPEGEKEREDYAKRHGHYPDFAVRSPGNAIVGNVDGLVAPARSSVKFRMAPLVARPDMDVTYALVDVITDLAPENRTLSIVEDFARYMDWGHHLRDTRYLVANNYWAVSPQSTTNTLLQMACRENAEILEQHPERCATYAAQLPPAPSRIK